ncbi:hypothetical protein ES708_11241 [subsurface metagenome]
MGAGGHGVLLLLLLLVADNQLLIFDSYLTGDTSQYGFIFGSQLGCLGFSFSFAFGFGFGFGFLLSRRAGQLGAYIHRLPLFNQNLPAGRQRVFVAVDLEAADLYQLALLVINNLGDAVYFRNNSLALGWPGFEKLFHPGQTAGDIQPHHPTGVEGTQRELGARLADTLGGDYAHGGVGFNQVPAGKVSPVAALAGAVPGVAA